MNQESRNPKSHFLDSCFPDWLSPELSETLSELSEIYFCAVREGTQVDPSFDLSYEGKCAEKH
jgi:hypothetical protein